LHVRADGLHVEVAERICGSRRARLAFNALSSALVATVAVLVARHFAQSGWPLAGAEPRLVAAAGLLFLAGYALKAYGWQRLFAPAERPGSLALAAATGAASVSGAALPGRVDDAVRIAVLRRLPGTRPGIGSACLSLFMLGLIDTVALMPLAVAAAATSDVPLAVRIGLGVVAFAGLGAAAVVVALPRLPGTRIAARFRLTRWLAARTACTREARRAALFVLLSWLVRATGLFLLLGAVGLGLSFPLAVAFLCAGAASGALPVAPAGAATQAGAGAALLVASGVSTTEAIAFAVGAQALVVTAGAAVVLVAAMWHGGSRLRVARFA
jgi:uncharacterized membrane protein YbhN (UPF0104 family)